MQLVVYPLLHVLLYLSLMFAPRDANRCAISGPGLAYELTRDPDAAEGGWTVVGGEFAAPAKVSRDGDKLVISPEGDDGRANTVEVGGRVRALASLDEGASGLRPEADAEHLVKKTPDGFRFLVNPGRPDEKEYRVVYRTEGTGRSGPVRRLAEATPSASRLRANVLGAVARPGAYSLPAGATATEALVAAGDVIARADLAGSIILRGAAGEMPQVIPFSPGVIRRGEALDVPLLDRDTLYVPPLRKSARGDAPNATAAAPARPVSPPPAPAQEFEFGGVEWLAWRTLFEVRGSGAGKELVSLPKARPGFDYGHWGHGRGPEIVTNIGNPDWRDYRIDADLLVPGVDPAFNPHGLGLDFHGAMIAFHVVDKKESFNESGTSAYILGFEGPGNWSLSAYRNHYCRQPQGWGSPGSDHERKLAGGSDVALDLVAGNRFRIEVLGKRIQVWIDGRKFVDVVDEQMDEVIGGRALDHGGVAFVGGFDAMIRLRSFEITPLAMAPARHRLRATSK